MTTPRDGKSDVGTGSALNPGKKNTLRTSYRKTDDALFFVGLCFVCQCGSGKACGREKRTNPLSTVSKICRTCSELRFMVTCEPHV